MPSYKKRIDRIRRGENKPQAKLTDDKVRQIRQMHREGWSIARLAKEFGVGVSTMNQVVKGITWKHVKDEPTTSVATPNGKVRVGA